MPSVGLNNSVIKEQRHLNLKVTIPAKRKQIKS